MSNQFTHPWTDQDVAFLRQNIGKLTYQQMGVVLNRSYTSVQSKIRYLPFQKKVKKHAVNIDFFKSYSPNIAYVLGLIAADGNICHSGKAHALHLASDDKDVIEKVKRLIEYGGPIYEKHRGNGKVSYSLRICDQTIFKDLQNLGITERKSLTLRPQKVPTEYLSHYLRGFFDGDGSVWLNKRGGKKRLCLVWWTGSLVMAEFLLKCVRGVCPDFKGGVVQGLTPNRNNYYYSVTLSHRDAKLMFQFLYSQATIYMERKYRKFLEGMTNA